MSTMWSSAVFVLACALLLQVSADSANLGESDAKYWLENGRKTMLTKSKMQLKTNHAKNVIIFLGDGMSLTTLTAARIYKAQMEGKNKTSESDHLSFEQFPFTGISKTYCVDHQVADSACSATAYLCGVKNNKGTIGVTSKVNLWNCSVSGLEENRPTSIMQWAQLAGKATGIVTTTRVTHASPAGAYAHTPHRDWESDAEVPEEVKVKANITQCYDIAQQLVSSDPGRNFKVIMGGGRDYFTLVNSTGKRSDEDLITKWKNDKQKRFAGKTAKYITNREELLNTDMSKVDFVLGLFHKSHMEYRLKSNESLQPTLQEMTRNAIQLLQKEPNGFVLFVEGGLIDMAHHNLKAKLALDETVEFSKAVENAVNLTNEDETLIVVTSDHAHTMSMAGYSKRGNNILGTSTKSAQDQMPYTTLSYANGPKTSYNYNSTCGRTNITNDDFASVDYQYPSTIPLRDETHGGDDVMVFARGPWAHLFTGNFEQNEIPLAMAFAAGISNESNSVSGANVSFNLAGQSILIMSVLLSAIGFSQFGL